RSRLQVLRDRPREEGGGLRKGVVALAELLQVTREFSAALVTVVRIFRDGTRNDCIKLSRDFALERRHWHWFYVHHLEADRLSAVALKRSKPSDHAVQDHAEREQV